VGGFLWNLLVNIENLLSWVAGLAAAAVFVENITIPHNKNLAEVKRAEIKAGTIVGTIVFIVLIGFEKIGFEHLKNYIEQKYFS